MIAGHVRIKLILLLSIFVTAFWVWAGEAIQPTRHVSIIASQEGFYPERLSVFKGEKIRFFVTSSSKEPSCFLMRDLGVFLSASMGTITEAEVVFDKVGRHEFFCPKGNIKGFLTVLEHPVAAKEKAQREIASAKEKKKEKKKDKIVEYWTPREN